MAKRKRKSVIDDRSLVFNHTRKDHALELAQDYVELIADMIEERGEARVCELAKHLGVSHVTAIKALERLEKLGFLKKPKYKPIILTRKGKALAKECKRRHELVLQFLQTIGVSSAVAERDAEGIEHHISKETMKALKRVISEFSSK